MLSISQAVQADLIIGILGGVLALASLSLAIFGFIFSTYSQIMSQIDIKTPAPKILTDLKNLAYDTFYLIALSSFIVILCIAWMFFQKELLFLFICGSVIILLICICAMVLHIIWHMIIVPKGIRGS